MVGSLFIIINRSSQACRPISIFLIKRVKIRKQNGIQIVSHLENGHRSITPEIAIAYAIIFNTSLDYIYGLSDDEFRDPRLKGLSDKAIKAMLQFKFEILDYYRRAFEYRTKK